MRVATVDRTKDWTVEDYLLLGEIKTPCQLINGELIMNPAPNPLHQRISREIFKILDKESQKSKGEVFYAPIDLYLDKKNVFQPDLVYLSDKKEGFVSSRGIEGPPDLIIEIISPSNGYTDRNQKKNGYQRFGVTEYWIVDPANETLEVYSGNYWDSPSLYLAEEGEVTSVTLKDLKFNLKELFNP
jgi:Uma2 family endonuclease